MRQSACLLLAFLVTPFAVAQDARRVDDWEGLRRVSGIPVLYVPRNDWPESPWLIRWLEQHVHCAEIDRARLERGELAPAIEALLARGEPVPVEPRGVSQTVEIIEALL